MTKTATPPRTKRRSKGHYVCAWIEENCVHTEGKWRGRPFTLLRFQRSLIIRLFEVDDENLRRFIWALIGLPKGNGKTELAAALACFFAIGDDEPSPLVVCAAASDEQADKVFGAASTMCELSSSLKSITERYEKEIYVPHNNGRIRRVAASGGLQEGQRIYVVIADELHEWLTEKHVATWNVLTNSTGGRGVGSRPMILAITTAGSDKDTVLGQMYDEGKQIESGELDVDDTFFFWIEAPPDAPLTVETFRACNPAHGVMLDDKFFETQLRKKPEHVIRRYFFNQWTETAETSWVRSQDWDACRAKEITFDAGLPVHVGIDIGLKHDTTAVLVAQRQGEQVAVKSRVWANPFPIKDSRHDSWKLPYAEVNNYLLHVYQQFPQAAIEIDDEVMEGPAFWYDPSRFEANAQELEGMGLNMVEAPQYDSVMVPATETTFQLILDRRLNHDGDKVLRRHVLNAVAQETKRGGFRIARPKPRRNSKTRPPIDACTGLVMAAWKAEVEPIPTGQRKASGKFHSW